MLMVARVNLIDNTVRAFVIPRDLWVTVPGYGEEYTLSLHHLLSSGSVLSFAQHGPDRRAVFCWGDHCACTQRW